MGIRNCKAHNVVASKFSKEQNRAEKRRPHTDEVDEAGVPDELDRTEETRGLVPVYHGGRHAHRVLRKGVARAVPSTIGGKKGAYG